jgi:hypothetical protein
MTASKLRTRSPQRLLKIEDCDFSLAHGLDAARAAIAAMILVKDRSRFSKLTQ